MSTTLALWLSAQMQMCILVDYIGGALFLNLVQWKLWPFLITLHQQKELGATYLLIAIMTEDAAKVTFINNAAVYGGTLQLFNSSINIINSNMFFVDNKASVWDGGPIHLMNSKINISKHANVSFIRNTAAVQRGPKMQTSMKEILICSSLATLLTSEGPSTYSQLFYMQFS